MVYTPRLLLVNTDVPILEQLLKGDRTLAEYTGWTIETPWNEFGRSSFRYTLDKIREAPENKQWWTYLIILKSQNQLIGSCGFKGPPTLEGRVEIGYEIKKSFRNQGFATETAQGLIDWAFTNDTVKRVQAHTLPEENASTSVLKKVGMTFAGPVEIATHGEIWKWAIQQER